MKTGITRIMFAVAAIMLAAVGIVVGTDGDAFGTDGGDLAQPALVAHVVGAAFVLENVGTCPSVDCGGARIIASGETVGLLPYVTVLAPNPFIFTESTPMAPKWFQKVQLTRALVVGEKFTVTNGVGVYAMGVAQ